MISVCFIVKNEAKNLGACIEHLRPLVQEVIVVDTGSTDDTVDIAKSKADRVEFLKWPNDFSAARNFSLQFATQDWILKIDPDERIDPRDFQKIRDLTKRLEPAFQWWTRAYTNSRHAIGLQSYTLCRGEHPEFEKNYRAFISYPSIRFFKRLPTTKFSGKVHESIEPSLPGYSPGNSPVPEPLEIYFHHYGHSDEAFEERQKSPFYENLLVEEVKENPKNWYAHFELGKFYWQQGKIEAAYHAYKLSNRALPKKPQVLANLGLLAAQMGRRDEGLRFLNECLSVDPQYHDAYLNRGVLEMESERFAEALKDFHQCLRLDPRSHLAYRARAQAHAKLGHWKESEADFQKALALVPVFSEAKMDLALLYRFQGNEQGTRKLVEEVLKEDPQNPRALEFLKQI